MKPTIGLFLKASTKQAYPLSPIPKIGLKCERQMWFFFTPQNPAKFRFFVDLCLYLGFAFYQNHWYQSNNTMCNIKKIINFCNTSKIFDAFTQNKVDTFLVLFFYSLKTRTSHVQSKQATHPPPTIHFYGLNKWLTILIKPIFLFLLV